MIKPKRKPIEPLNLFGENSWISSLEEAASVLRDNSYYIIVVGFIHLGILGYIRLSSVNLDMSEIELLLFGIFYVVSGFSIRIFKSRVASSLTLASFVYGFIINVLAGDTSAITGFTALFLAASYRAVRASIEFHKLNKTVIQWKKWFVAGSLVLIVCIGGYEYLKKTYVELTVSIYKEDFTFKSNKDEKSCLVSATNSLKKNDGFMSQYAVLAGFSYCLDQIDTSNIYCVNVPARSDQVKSSTWQDNLNKEFNISGNAWSKLLRELQMHCEKT